MSRDYKSIINVFYDEMGIKDRRIAITSIHDHSLLDVRGHVLVLKIFRDCSITARARWVYCCYLRLSNQNGFYLVKTSQPIGHQAVNLVVEGPNEL